MFASCPAASIHMTLVKTNPVLKFFSQVLKLGPHALSELWNVSNEMCEMAR